MKNTLYTWTIKEVIDETPNVRTLVLTMNAPRPEFIAGQYLTVKLVGHNPIEGKAYSISSAPHETNLTLTIKKMGSYSSELLSKNVGDTIDTSAPYGFFYPESDDSNCIVFIAGGIGITPCMSIINQLCHANDTHLIHLFYSNQTTKDVVFQDKLISLARQHTNFTYHSHITRQESVSAPHIHGRMNATSVLQQLQNTSPTTFFLCGSQFFTRDLWKDLRSVGIPSEQIYTEGFF